MPRKHKRGPNRYRPRVEELIKFSVHKLVTNKCKSYHIDNEGTWIEFVDEMVAFQPLLTVYIDGKRSNISFHLIDVPLTGWIKNDQIYRDNDCIYFMIDHKGNRCRYVYIDPVNKLVGSRHTFNAIYTSESVSKKKRHFWRELQRLKKKLRRA